MRWWRWLFPRLRGFGENVDSFIPCLHFFFFFKVEISLHTPNPLFRPGSVCSGSASRNNCGRMFPDKLCVSSFPDRSQCYAWSAAQSTHSHFIGSRVYVCLCVICHLHFWVSLHATAVTQGWNGHRMRVSTQS